MITRENSLDRIFAEKTKFFTLVATNLSGERKKVKFLSDYALKDGDVTYTCNGDEESYFKIMKEIEKNPLLIYKIRLQSSDNFYRPDLFSMNRFSLKKQMTMESRMILPLSYIKVSQYQAFVVDIPTAFGLDYSSDISYIIEPNTSVSVSFFAIPYDKVEHEKLKNINSSTLNGHPVWVTNKTDEHKTFNLYTDIKDYSKEELDSTDFEYKFWQNTMHISGVVDNLFSKQNVSNFSITRIYSENISQLENSLDFSSGDGNTKSIVPSASYTTNQFINTICDISEEVFSSSEKRIKNLYGRNEKNNPSFLKTIIKPNTTVCIWIETFNK